MTQSEVISGEERPDQTVEEQAPPGGGQRWGEGLARWGGLLVLLGLAVVVSLPGWAPGRLFVSAGDEQGPGAIHAARCLKHGILPLWNPYQHCGQPLAGSGASGVFYPTMLLHMALPIGWSFTVSALLRLFVAGAGVWVLAGRHGILPPGRMIAGAAFMLGGYSLTKLHGPEMNVVPLMPWAIVALERLIDGRSLGRAMALAGVLAIAFLGGHFEAAKAMVVTLGVVWGVRVVVGRVREGMGEGSGETGREECKMQSAKCKMQNGGRGEGMEGRIGESGNRRIGELGDRLGVLVALPAVVLGVVVGVMVAGVQWVPVLVEGGAEAFRPAGLQGRWWAGLLLPYLSREGGAGGWIGTVPLLLALLGIAGGWRQKRVLLWGAMGMVALLMARHSPSLLASAGLGLAILAGVGLEVLRRRLPAGRPVPLLGRGELAPAAPWVCLLLVAVELLVFGMPYNLGVSRKRYFAGAGAIGFVQKQAVSSSEAPFRVAAGAGVLGGNTATVVGLASVGGEGRILPRAAQALGEAAGPEDAVLRLAGVRYYLALADAPSPGAEWKQVYPEAGKAEPVVVYERSSPLPRAWIARTVSPRWQATAGEALGQVRRAGFDPRQMLVLDRQMDPIFLEVEQAQTALLRAAAPAAANATMRWLEDSPNRIRLQIQGGGGWLVLADAYADGWTATIGPPKQMVPTGRRSSRSKASERAAMIAPAFGLFRAIPLPQMPVMEVSLEYAPRPWRHGALLSLAGILILAMMGGLSLARRSKE